MAYSVNALDASVLLVLVVLYFLLRLASSRRSAPYPPGPKGLPLVGNVLDIPSQHAWKTVADWSKLYGSIIHINVMGQPMVFLNSLKSTSDMLDKKSLIYSDRPYFTMACGLMGWDETMGLRPFGKEHSAMRKLVHLHIGTRASVAQCVSTVEDEVRSFLKLVLDDPADFVSAIGRASGAIILQITYGYEPKEHDDPLVDLIDRCMEQFSITTKPGAFLVDVLPILRYVPAWFPGAGFKRVAPAWAQCLKDLVELPVSYVKEQMARGTAFPSFTSRFLEGHPSTHDEYIIKWAAASIYGGGADTTACAVKTFFMTMMLYPEVQQKAQAEIDSIIGTGRLPCLADKSQLPYVEALVKEVFRWNPVAPLGVPHRLMEDDIHDGYFVPKGTIITANIWKFLHDPETYTEPTTFKPERFLGCRPEQDPLECCFGFGRRACPGCALAEASVWITCAASLAVFDISKPLDELGRPYEPNINFTSTTVSHPMPFKCTVKPRTDASRTLILADNAAK